MNCISLSLEGRLCGGYSVLAAQADEKGFRAKISDFGLSQHMTKDQQYVLVSKGTEAYLPVEVFKHLQLTEKSDIYALGLVMWEIFYGIFWHSIYEKEKARRGCASTALSGDRFVLFFCLLACVCIEKRSPCAPRICQAWCRSVISHACICLALWFQYAFGLGAHDEA